VSPFFSKSNWWFIQEDFWWTELTSTYSLGSFQKDHCTNEQTENGHGQNSNGHETFVGLLQESLLYNFFGCVGHWTEAPLTPSFNSRGWWTG
jgi:hypothetical protein